MSNKYRFSAEKFNSAPAKRIRELLEFHKMTHAQLATKIDVSESAVSQFQAGKSAPKLDTLVKIAKVFGTTTDYLLEITDDPNVQHSVIDETGLSNNSVKTLKYLKSMQDHGYYHLSVINTLLSYPNLNDILDSVEAYFSSVHAKEIFKHHHDSIIKNADKVEYEYSFPELCLYLSHKQDEEIDISTNQYIEETKQYYQTVIGLAHSGQYNKLITHHMLELLDSSNPHESKLDYIYAARALEALKSLKDYICEERMKIIKETLLSTEQVEKLDTITISW